MGYIVGADTGASQYQDHAEDECELPFHACRKCANLRTVKDNATLLARVIHEGACEL